MCLFGDSVAAGVCYTVERSARFGSPNDAWRVGGAAAVPTRLPVQSVEATDTDDGDELGFCLSGQLELGEGN